MNDTHSLSHTKWNCKYQVVFAPKYRRKLYYGEKRLEIGAVLRELLAVNFGGWVTCRFTIDLLQRKERKEKIDGGTNLNIRIP